MSRDLPTREKVAATIDYDPEAGTFTWKARPDAPPGWNARWAGRAAGSLDSYGYRSIHIERRLHKAHRLAWLLVHGEWPNGDVDHANRDKDDNRIGNLRDCTRAENLQNQCLRADSTSGFQGVSLCKHTGRWRAKITVGGEQVHLGRFDTAEAASEAYQIAKGGLHPFHHTIAEQHLVARRS